MRKKGRCLRAGGIAAGPPDVSPSRVAPRRCHKGSTSSALQTRAGDEASHFFLDLRVRPTGSPSLLGGDVVSHIRIDAETPWRVNEKIQIAWEYLPPGS